MIYFSKKTSFAAAFAFIFVLYSSSANAAGIRTSGTQLACGQGPDRQTQIFGNYFKIVNNGILIYDNSTKDAADTLVPESNGTRGVDDSLKMPVGNISDITYVKYSQSMKQWLNCPLDFVQKDVSLVDSLIRTSTQDSRCAPISSANLTDISQQNQNSATVNFSDGGVADINPCAASDPDCPEKPGIAGAQAIHIQMDSGGNLKASVSCSDANGGNTTVQQFVQNIGSGSSSSGKTSIDAGKMTLPQNPQ